MKRLLTRILILSVLAAAALVALRVISRRRAQPAQPYRWTPPTPDPPVVHVHVHPPDAEPAAVPIDEELHQPAPAAFAHDAAETLAASTTSIAPATEGTPEPTAFAPVLEPIAESVQEPEEAAAADSLAEATFAVPPPADAPAPADEDLLTHYFNKLADTPDEELFARLANMAEPGLNLAPALPPLPTPRPSYAPPPPPEPPHRPTEAAPEQMPSTPSGDPGDELPQETPPPPTPPLPREEISSALPQSLEDALTEIAPMPIVAPPRRTAESYLDEGNVYFNVGQYELAIERYSTAVEMDRELVAAYYNRANAHTRSGNFERALADYDRALELQPFDADVLNNRGMLHLYRANYPSALRDFNAALVIDPADTTVIVNRGLAHLHSGEAVSALHDFREAVAVDGEDAAAHYGASQASAVLGNTDDAIRSVARALELNPGYAPEAAADPNLIALQGDPAFLKLLRESGAQQ